MGRILVVDDDDGVREALSETLRDEGYAVIAAADGQEALDWMREHGVPCLILLDLWMPRVDGLDFRRQQLAEAAWKDVPVVVISAANDAQKVAAGMRVAGCLRKPISLAMLLTLVAEYC